MRVLVANAYVGNSRPWRFARWVRRQRPDYALISEATKVARALRVGRGRFHAARDGSRGKRENGVWTPRLRAAVSATWRLTEDVEPGGPPGFGHDRWVRQVQRGNQVVYSFHANALIQNKTTGDWARNERARAWRQGLQLLERSVSNDIRNGNQVIVGGDGNVRDYGGASMSHFFDSLGMKSCSVGLMWIGWTPGLNLDRFRSLDTPPGADGHRAIVADFVEARRA